MSAAVHTPRLGDSRHGVVRYGEQLATAVRAHLAARPELQLGPITHVHYSDSTGCAPAEVRRRSTSDRLVVTIHDTPGTDDASGDRRARRIARYRAATDRADVVVVCSHHEARAASAWCARRIVVIPHLVAHRPPIARIFTSPPTVGMLGFAHAGKDLDAVIRATAAVDAIDRVVVLGRAEAPVARRLSALAHTLHLELEISGWLSEDELDDRITRVSVPVVAHRHVSASGSLARWRSSGRRPIALTNPYVEEMQQLDRNGIWSTVPDRLVAHIEQAVRQPSSTWCTEVPAALRPEAVAERHVRLYRRLR